MMIHQMSSDQLLKLFSPDEAIEQVEISCAEAGDMDTSDPQVEELLSDLYEASDKLRVLV